MRLRLDRPDQELTVAVAAGDGAVRARLHLPAAAFQKGLGGLQRLGLVGKGGIVKDPAAQAEALQDAKGFLEGRGWRVRASADSPIAGGDGNREFLVWATRS